MIMNIMTTWQMIMIDFIKFSRRVTLTPMPMITITRTMIVMVMMVVYDQRRFS